MVVAGAGMRRSWCRRGAPPDSGVGLQLDEAVDDLHAGAFEVARPADIGFFVEARLQLYQRGDRHLLQRLPPAPGRSANCSVRYSVCDRDHVGSRRLGEPRRRRFVGVMDDKVLLPERREDVAARVAHALGMARNVGRELEVGPVQPRQLRQLVHRQHAIDQEHFVVGGRKSALHEQAQFLRHLRVDLEPDHRSAAPALQRGLEQADQILGLFLDFDFGVTDDAEGALALHGVAGE